MCHEAGCLYAGPHNSPVAVVCGRVESPEQMDGRLPPRLGRPRPDMGTVAYQVSHKNFATRITEGRQRT